VIFCALNADVPFLEQTVLFSGRGQHLEDRLKRAKGGQLMELADKVIVECEEGEYVRVSVDMEQESQDGGGVGRQAE
jgi:hypothetical protein